MFAQNKLSAAGRSGSNDDPRHHRRRSLLAFLAFKFIKGMIKFALLAVIVLFGLFIAHEAGAF